MASLAAIADLTRAALRGDAAVVDGARVVGLATPVAPELARRLHFHQVLGPIAAALEDAGDPATAAALREAQATVRRVPAVSPGVLLDAFVEVRDTLAAAAVPVLLLKGAALSVRLFGVHDRRSQHDVDILVRAADARRARRVLRGLGFERVGGDRHAVTFRRGPVRVDLHHALRVAPAYRVDEEAVWRAARQVSLDGVQALTTGDADTLTLLAASITEDTGYATVKLRQLCDLWLLARGVDATFDWDGWLGARTRERLDAVCATGAALALSVLDVADDVPRLAGALERHRSLVRVGRRDEALALVAAPRNDPASMAWFARVYPGSLWAYRAAGVAAGLPGSLRRLNAVRPGWQRRFRRARALGPHRTDAAAAPRRPGPGS